MLGRSYREKIETDSKEEVRIIQKKFLADMSYDIRNPLNEICGITEIALKNIETNGDRDMLKAYLEIIRDSGFELQKVIDERFAQFENDSDLNNIENNSAPKNDSYNKDERYKVLNNMRMLVIEDNETSALIARELMTEYGAIVTVCHNGKDGVEKFKNSITGTYDVIFMDIKMPEMDGYEATELIRNSNHQQAKSIPIIAMTAETFAEDIKNALRSGMNAHVAKPVNIDKIVAAINKAIV